MNVLDKWPDNFAVEIRKGANPSSFAGTGEIFGSGMPAWQIQIHQPRPGSKSHGCTASGIGGAMGCVEQICRIVAGVHAHCLAHANQSCLGLENYNSWFVFADIYADSPCKVTCFIDQHFVDHYLVHDFGTGFLGCFRETGFLVGTVIFQMITAASRHGMTFKIPCAGWTHVDSVRFPFVDKIG